MIAGLVAVAWLIAAGDVHAAGSTNASWTAALQKNGPGTNDAMDEFVLAQMREQHIVGLSLAVVERGTPVKIAGYGWANIQTKTAATPETIFQIQSVTKCFVGAAVALLIHDGKLSPEDKVVRWITNAPTSWSNITVRHLLTHTAGLKDFINEPTIDLAAETTDDAILASVRDLPLEFTPGAKYAYSNTGYQLLGMIIERATGRSWFSFVKERILQPFGMHDTTLVNLSDESPRVAKGYLWRDGELHRGRRLSQSVLAYPGGGCVSTAQDMARWDAGLDSGRVFTTNVLAEMWNYMKLNGGGFSGYGYGFGLSAPGTPRHVIHVGAHATGFTSVYLRYPEQRLGIAVLVNQRFSKPENIARGIAALHIPSLGTNATAASKL
jgi:CubicO group peptidase (beta-lactamase class C family)